MEGEGHPDGAAPAAAAGVSSGVMGSISQITDSEEFQALAKILFPDVEDPKLGIYKCDVIR